MNEPQQQTQRSRPTQEPLQSNVSEEVQQQREEEPQLSPEEVKEVEREATEAMKLPAVTQQQQQNGLTTPEWAAFQLNVHFAQAFATSGLFGLRGKGKNVVPLKQAVAAAFVRIEVGKSLGFDPAQSMMGISIVNDKPVVEYRILAARCKQIGYDWDTAFTYDKASRRCTGCRLYLKRDGKPVMQTKRDDDGNPIQKVRDGKPVFDADGDPVYEAVQVTQSFTEADAKRIKQEMWRNNSKQFVSLWDKDTYQNYGENMFFSRAFHNLQKFHMSEAINAPVFLKEARDAEDIIDTYESGPDKFSSYGGSKTNSAASNQEEKPGSKGLTLDDFDPQELMQLETLGRQNKWFNTRAQLIAMLADHGNKEDFKKLLLGPARQ